MAGTNKERLVSVASAQALHRALPEADLWFWDVADTVHEVTSQKLLEHSRPFQDEFKPGTRGLPLGAALDKARSEDRVLVLACMAAGENGELQAMCELRGIPFTRLRFGVVEPRLRQGGGETLCGDCGRRGPGGVALEDLDAAFAEYGRLIAKPARDGSSTA